MCLLTLPADAQDRVPSLTEVRIAFQSMPMEVRSRAQNQMIASDLYRGRADGVWGPGTEAAFREGMRLDVYRDFARSLPSDPAAAARETVLFFAPEVFAD